MAHGPPPARKSDNNNLKTNNNDATVTENIDDIPVAPDGGWGWVVVFGSFMLHVITDGLTYSFGIFYTEFLTYFNEGKGYTAWIASTLIGVTLCSGPISSAFVNKYGCRAVTIAGAILAAVCLVGSMFAQNVLTLIILIGFGTGLGLGLIYLPAIVSVTMWFEKYRSVATGIAVCGAGVGTFVFAPLTGFLIQQFGWRGAMLIVSGIVMHCVLFGALFRPIPTSETSEKQPIELQEMEPYQTKESNNHIQIPSVQVISDDRTDPQLTRSQSVGHSLMKSWHHHRPHHKSSHGKLSIKSPVYRPPLEGIRTTLSQPLLNADDIPNGGQIFESHKHMTMSRPDIFYQGSLLNIPHYRSHEALNESDKYGSFRMLQARRHSDTMTVEKQCCSCLSPETENTFRQMINFSLFKDWVFVIFTVSNFCTSLGFYIPYICIDDHVNRIGMTKKDGGYLLAFIGIANIFGRIILGYLADKPWVNRLLVYSISLTLCGIATIVSIFCRSFVTYAIYSAFYGFTNGVYVGLTSVILVDLLGLDKLTNAFGVLLLCQGIASFLGPPLAGTISDITGSYSLSFILAGISIAFSGLILFTIPPIQKRRAMRAAAVTINDQKASESLTNA